MYDSPGKQIQEHEKSRQQIRIWYKDNSITIWINWSLCYYRSLLLLWYEFLYFFCSHQLISYVIICTSCVVLHNYFHIDLFSTSPFKNIFDHIFQQKIQKQLNMQRKTPHKISHKQKGNEREKKEISILEMLYSKEATETTSYKVFYLIP